MNREYTIFPDRMLAALLFFICLATVFDLISDGLREESATHVIVEGLIFLGSFLAFLFLLRRVRRAVNAISVANRHLVQKNDEALIWKKRAKSLLEGLQVEIHSQFDKWKLTRAEKDVALFLIKGFSHQEVADFTHRSERTIRQHAGMIYQKSHLSGRAELAAFFLEDLLSPNEDHQ